jgi:hypothetical protein
MLEALCVASSGEDLVCFDNMVGGGDMESDTIGVKKTTCRL